MQCLEYAHRWELRDCELWAGCFSFDSGMNWNIGLLLPSFITAGVRLQYLLQVLAFAGL